ncbi:MAG: hypothetical protein DRQ52_03905 [Gammaproteobacteria bacterium]|nr:MAG: hypothetical protein DRQ52_03905 [Gammaproteobacteria bacterium]
MKKFAHSENRWGVKHSLREHLTRVADLAEEYLLNGTSPPEGRLAGLLHDLGKYGNLFQRRLEGKESGLDHWTVGAWMAMAQYKSLAAAFTIYGHHVGLPSFQELKRISKLAEFEKNHPYGLRLSDSDCERLMARFTEDGLSVDKPAKPIFTSNTLSLGDMLDQRRIFSALTDADFIDTEAHFNGDENGKVYRESGPTLQAEKALEILQVELDCLSANSDPGNAITRVRKTLLNNCLDAASNSTGLFTLTAPTGSGKTLAMLVFALQHAVKHKLRRVVMVIPYLTITEQTAKIYRDLFEAHFGPHYVLEHHSLAGMGKEDSKADAEQEQERQRRLLSENWDAPIVITTSVQMLESLFSNRPSSCRKLHRLAESVILFDEVQTLPLHLSVPTLAALSHLAHQWRSSVVFSTATQPAFQHLQSQVIPLVETGWQPHEIVSQPQQMADQLRRVTYHWPEPNQQTDWPELAQNIEQQAQALCIVNLKKHAKALWETLVEEAEDEESVLHLSTNLCAAHRQQVLEEVRQKLDDKRPITLVATQCVEAGVDIDFPAVWRSIAPLDAIIQAAGRCNREGKLEKGELTVFIPEDTPYPPMAGYLQATKITEHLLRTVGTTNFDPHQSELIQRYYRELYDLGRPSERAKELLNAIKNVDFPEVAQQYRLIKQDSINIIVPYTERSSLYKELLTEASEQGLSQKWIRKARPLTVSLYRPKAEEPIWGALQPVNYLRTPENKMTDWFVYLRKEDYHPNLGLVPPKQLHLWMA